MICDMIDDMRDDATSDTTAHASSDTFDLLSPLPVAISVFFFGDTKSLPTFPFFLLIHDGRFFSCASDHAHVARGSEYRIPSPFPIREPH
jgi:hypothetical protein